MGAKQRDQDPEPPGNPGTELICFSWRFKAPYQYQQKNQGFFAVSKTVKPACLALLLSQSVKYVFSSGMAPFIHKENDSLVQFYLQGST